MNFTNFNKIGDSGGGVKKRAKIIFRTNYSWSFCFTVFVLIAQLNVKPIKCKYIYIYIYICIT